MRPSLLHKYTCASINELETEHASLLRTMVSVDCVRVLLIGEPGTGKSTICRVLLHDYYGDIDTDNVMHISNLSDQGINFYRNDVRTFCQTTCSLVGKKKTLVIDDMDTLAEAGQQVFLHYTDTFPRVNFIVTATTTTKITSGMNSRLLCLKLQPFTPVFLRRELDRIARLEGVKMDSDAADIIVARSGRSMRMLLNYLEKIILIGGGLTREIVDRCSNIDSRYLDTFNEALERKDEYVAMDVVLMLHRDGFSVMDILDAYFTYVKLCSLSDARKYVIIRILAKYIIIFNQLHEHAIELIFCVHDLCA